MNKLINFSIGFFFIGYIITVTNGCCHTCVCPDFNLQGNLSDPAVAGPIATNIIDKLWSSSTPVLSKKAQALKSIILTMAHSDVPQYFNMAYLITIFGWSAAPHIKSKPNLCGFAQSINNTVDWQTNKNCTALFEAFDSLTASVNDQGKMVAASAIKAAGCGCTKVTPSTTSCYAGGTVYKAKELWNLRGYQYPCALRAAALRLYYSKNPLDQLFGAVATSGLADSTGGFVKNYNSSQILQVFNSQITPKIPKCCCKKFRCAMNKMVANIGSESQTATAALKASYPECC